MKYQVWMEGFHAQGGDPAQASLVGEVEADSFQEACDKLCNANYAGIYDSKQLSVWGCQLYDNEAAARKFMG